MGLRSRFGKDTGVFQGQQVNAVLRVALVHDWLTGVRGGEHVLEAIAEVFPRADLFTLIYVPGKVPPILTTLKRKTSMLQKVPRIEGRYRRFFPIMPYLIERFDLHGYDLVISSSHCVAKGIRKPSDSVHLSYVHAPMRYMWDRFGDYFGVGRSSAVTRLIAGALRSRLQDWDRKVSCESRVDSVVANSRYIAEQIREHYGREAKVVYPFCDLNRFGKPRTPGRNYLMVGAFAPYKRVDLAIEAFNQIKLPLLIVGVGQDEKKLRRLAGPTVEFLGSLSNAAVADLYSRCRALVFPGLEDFGIVPLEAMAAGAPVIAYGRGGVSETVTSSTGILFQSQTVEALIEAIQQMEETPLRFSEAECRARASHFSKDRFQREFVQILSDVWVAAGKSRDLLRDSLLQNWSSVGEELAKHALG